MAKIKFDFDFTPCEWENLIKKCGFTDEELQVIDLKRKGYRHLDVAEKMKYSEPTISRRISQISKKIFKFI